MQNKTLIFKKIPSGAPVAGEHLVVEDRPIDLDTAPPGGTIVEVLSVSLDPYLRNKLRDPKIKSYSPPFDLDSPVVEDTVSRVIKSDNPNFQAGDLVLAHVPIAEYASVPADPPKIRLQDGVRKFDNPYNLDLGHFLGAGGMPGLTAYSGLYRIGKPKKGETIFVSSAAGAVGQLVGQLAKREGLKVIGSVGSEDKLEFIINELGFDGAFNYKKETATDALPRLAPDGIDIYFDNVGGEQLEAAMVNMNVGGRIPVCGQIADYNRPPDQKYGIKTMFTLISKQIVMEGFLVGTPNFAGQYRQEHQDNIQKWLKDGSVKAKLDITEGIDQAAVALIGMLEGKNFGKAVLKIK